MLRPSVVPSQMSAEPPASMGMSPTTFTPSGSRKYKWVGTTDEVAELPLRNGCIVGPC